MKKLWVPALCLLLLSGCVKRAPRPSALNDGRSNSSTSSRPSSGSSSQPSSPSSSRPSSPSSPSSSSTRKPAPSSPNSANSSARSSRSSSATSAPRKKCGILCQLAGGDTRPAPKPKAKSQPKPQPVRTKAKPTRSPAAHHDDPTPTSIQPRSAELPETQDRGAYHTVKKGETLWRICHAYGADVQEVSRRNSIQDATQIAVGQRIFIPGAEGVQAVEPAPLPDAGDGDEGGLEGAPPPGASRGSLAYPVPGGINYSPFGSRHGNMHEGLDISAPSGTPVYAADDGKVVYAGNGITAYGNMIIIKHAGNMSTVYAHNSKNLVKVGDMVKRGDKIAEVGSTGRSTGPHCHFEVRVEEKAVNPEYYLPKGPKEE